MAKAGILDAGTTIDKIDVYLSYKIVDLFSEGLYASPNKAIEELVANSFDAGAHNVQILLSANMHAQDATIAVIDDGQGMDQDGLKQHWLIGTSNKRKLDTLPAGRQQIGKFGIGKLATYVLAGSLTHITKRQGKYYATTMNYGNIDSRVDKEVEPKTPIKIDLLQLTEEQAKKIVEPWVSLSSFRAAGMTLFGKDASDSWTVAIMSELKPKVHDIKPGYLEWVLRTALPLRPDFSIYLNGKKLKPSKADKGLLKRWVLGKDLVELSKPASEVSVSEDKSYTADSEYRFGFDVPGLGRVTGYAEAYKDLLTGKSDELGRSSGFFVYVFGRLVNVTDGHFGIPANELRHGSFGRFRAVVNMDGLDSALRSNREAVREGQQYEVAKNVLRSIFNATRPTIEKHTSEQEPGVQLAEKLGATPSSLSRAPIVNLARLALDGKLQARFLQIPEIDEPGAKELLIQKLEKRAEDAEQFVTGLSVEYSGSPEGAIARYDIDAGTLRINAWHPFVAAFYDDFASKTSGGPLEILAMAEVLNEALLYSAELPQVQVEEFLTARDQLLRYLANGSGRQSALAVASNLLEARNNPNDLEDKVCRAFKSLGFLTTPIGKSGNPDGVAKANISADGNGLERHYSVSLEAKSKQKDEGKVSAKTVGVSAIVRQRDKYECDHAIVVGRDFPADEESALAGEIDDDRRKTAALGHPKTITLITIDDLARLVRLRPARQIGLVKLRELFLSCRLPGETTKWIDAIQQEKTIKVPYREIIYAIETLQQKFKKSQVEYSALRVELAHLSKPIEYEKNDQLIDLCKGMAQMAPGAIYATSTTVELDQSAENVLEAITAAVKEYPIEEQ